MEADRVACVFNFEAGLQGAEDDFATLRGDRQRRRTAEIEVSAVPEVGLDSAGIRLDRGSQPAA